MLDPAATGDWLGRVLEPVGRGAWTLREENYTPLREAGIESRFAISNGLLGVRGSRAISRGPMWMSFLHTLSWASWPRTFVAGLFDTPNTEPPVPALVPAPDWLRLRLLLDGKAVMIRSGELLAHARTLDLERGVLLTTWRQRDPGGRLVSLRALRLVSLADRAVGMQLIEVVVDGTPAEVTLEAPLELTNSGLEELRAEPDVAVWRTASSGKCLGLASAVQLQVGDRVLPPAGDDVLRRWWTWTSQPGQMVQLRRLVAVARDDHADGEAAHAAARAALTRARRAGAARVLAAHTAAWAERWRASDVEIDGDDEAQRALRFAVYHLNGAANPDDERVSIGARALTGDAYLGHVFWDTEIYLLPFYVFTWPAAARALLMYRWHTLNGARAKAARLGYRGALYAWESADTGDETTPDQIVDPDGRLLDVLCGRLEQHISADVAYAVWQYWLASGDDAFMAQAGAEILLETARFWASRATLEGDCRYHIRDVIGPDEYHEHVDDNAFTNVMAAWNVSRALDVAAVLRRRAPERWSALTRALALDESELARWPAVAEGMARGFHPDTGLFEQFAGYFGLEAIDLSQYAGRHVPMDVVLGRERTQRSQVVKQADVVALLALLPDEFERRVQEANLRFYEPRCGHGSSLSRGHHAVVAARLGDVAMAERYFRETAATDLADTRGGSAGGVRIAALGGLWQAAVLGFAGLRTRADGLALDPHLPSAWQAMRFGATWRDRSVAVALDARAGTVGVTLKAGGPMRLEIAGQAHALAPDRPLTVPWPGGR